MSDEIKGLQSVKDYYGKVLKSNQDLQTSACCTAESMPNYLLEILKDVHDEVKDKFYGCGSPIPLGLEGKTVLDLGSGSGRDCFLLSKLVGPRGKVIGVDMTDEQISIARKHLDYHTKKFGFDEPNISFLKCYIEDLEEIGIKSNSIDVVVSNCVINLSPSKDRVFSEIFRVLKPGGELYFSDIFSNRRIPQELTRDSLLVGECLGGAMYIEDFRRLLNRIGCADHRFASSAPIELLNPAIMNKVGKIEFQSMTVRAFKLNLEDRCEDHGQVAMYLGTIQHAPNAFVLDDHHTFEKEKYVQVCGNTAKMLQDTRYAEFFKVLGDFKQHFGLFDCDTGKTNESQEKKFGACC